MRLYVVGFAVVVLSVFVLLASGSSEVFAVSEDSRVLAVETTAPVPLQTPGLTEVNSFEVFWPLVAGKTQDEPFYFLKRWKENVRGFLIFGTPQKVDYSVLLATKRVLEVEKLMKEKKFDVAKNALESAQTQLDKAEKNIDAAKSSGQSLGQVSQVVVSRLSNIEKLAKWLSTQDSDLKSMLSDVGSKAGALSSKF